MSGLGGTLPASIAGATGAAESSGNVQAKREREKSDSSRRIQDAVDLKVAQVEGANAIRAAHQDDSDHADQDQPGRNSSHGEDDPDAHVDVTG